MKLADNYNILVFTKTHQVIDALQYLAYDLEQSEMNISAWIRLMNDLQEFSDLMARATPDWRIETYEQFNHVYQDGVQVQAHV